MIRLALVACLLMPVAGWAQQAPAPDLKGVRILVCGGYFDLLNIPAVKRLEAAGAQVRGGNLSALTWDTARQYHLIIVVDLPPVTTGQPVQALERFVKAGGGLLCFRHYYGSEKADEYLAPFGASLPWEVVLDPNHRYTCPTGFNLAYAYTDRVTAGHPVTEGVKGLWYSAQREHLFHSGPLKVSADWKVLVTGMPEASSLWIGGLNEEHLSKPGTFAAAPPLIAARDFGAGGVVLVGISPMEAFYGQGLPAYQNTLWQRGNGVQASDYGVLYDNALRWLSAKAKPVAELGQGELAPVEDTWAKADTFDWSKDQFGGDSCPNPARGVIGVHSTLSDGKATPEALIAKAKAAGLQWVAFTERLESFSPAKWEQLRKICRAASTPEFAALPGLDYADAAGARYVVFGDFSWPPEKVFSADGKQLINPQFWFNIGMYPHGPYDAGHSPLRPWDFSLYDMWPVRTTLAGKQVDEHLGGLRYTQSIQDDPFPMAVDMVYDEAQLTAAAGRMTNYVMLEKPGDLGKWYADHNYYGSYLGFVSDGPVVTDWRAVNNCRNSGGKFWLAGTEQYRLRLSVKSAAAIREVRIYDGEELLRRFAYDQPQVTLVLDLPHDRQRNLTAEITDAAGKRAFTGGLFTRDFNNWRFMCSDRGNSICDAIQTDAAGSYLTGPTAPYQRKMTVFGMCAGYGERHFNILPPEFDGGMRPVGMQVMPSFSTPGYTYQPPDTTLEAKIELPVCSRDGLLQDTSVPGYFPGTRDSWNPKAAPVDIKDVQVRFRALNLTQRAHDPSVILLEGSLRFAKAMKLDNLSVFRVFHSSQPGEGDHYALMTPTTNVSGMVAGEPFSAGAPLQPGSYLCVFPSLWGSTGAMALDEGYEGLVFAKAPGVHLNVSRSGLPREMKAGEEISYRLLLMHGRAGEPPNNAEWEQFARRMGLSGPPAYDVRDVKAGQVAGTRFLLELQPADGGFVGSVVPREDLPVRLPVRVRDMNPNWTCGWVDLDRKEWYPSAVDPLIRQGFFSLDTRRGAHRLFAGHPVLADNPEVRMAVFTDAKTVWRAVLNNAGDKAMALNVRLNPALGTAPAQQVTLAAGAQQEVTFEVK